MNIKESIWSRSVRTEEFLFVTVVTFISTFLYVVLVRTSGGDVRLIAFLPALVLMIMGLHSFQSASFLLVASLFVDIYFYDFSFGVWFTLPFGLSLLLRNRDRYVTEISNPLTIPLLIYGVCVLPSFLNASRPLVSFFMLFNVAAFLIVMNSMMRGLQTFREVRMIVISYLIWVLVDSLYVIALGLSGAVRPFGFAGIWFVDYSALGVCLSSVIALLSSGSRRVLALAVSLIIAAALVLTQTRSTWMSAIVTLGVFIVYVFLNAESLGFTRRRVIFRTVIGSIMMICVVGIVLSINPKIENRAIQITKQPGYGIDQQGNVENSLGSRILIWGTAISAFEAHPLFGIGVYSFRYSSYQYSQLPKFLYKKFVENLSVHQTHLAVLAETGLVGFVGFAFVVLMILKYSFQAIKFAHDESARQHALVAAVGVVYCVTSMFITDAWLWGQQIVLLGLVVGTMLAVRKISIVQKAANA